MLRSIDKDVWLLIWMWLLCCFCLPPFMNGTLLSSTKVAQPLYRWCHTTDVLVRCPRAVLPVSVASSMSTIACRDLKEKDVLVTEPVSSISPHVRIHAMPASMPPAAVRDVWQVQMNIQIDFS